METISLETLEKYLATSSLTPTQKKALVKEHSDKNGDRSVLSKAVQLNGRKAMTKVPTIHHK